VPEKLKEQLVADHRTAEIDEEDKVILDFVKVLTLRPQEITVATIRPLMDRGFSDRLLHDIVQVTAYFAYVNRIADGLGVELEK